jgi:hypothetical protein
LKRLTYGFSSHFPLRAVLVAAILYFVSSLVQAPPALTRQKNVTNSDFRVSLERPSVLSGDSPHYLAAIHSLVKDRDFDLSDNYRQARQGGEDLGRRFRGQEIDRHIDLDQKGRELGTHSPFFALLVSILVWPFHWAGWVEPAAIWATMAAALACLALAGRWWKKVLASTNGIVAERWVLVLALATPFWCYSRDLWTEVWVALCWVLLLSSKSRSVQAAGAFLGTLIKYPFVVVPLTMAALAYWKGDRRQTRLLASSAAAGLATVIVTIQILFRDVDHFSLFHSGIHAGFDLPFDGLLGLFLHPRAGLLWFFPVLAWALPVTLRKAEYLPLWAFVLVHAAYQDWPGGTGFSARYLVPALPLLVTAMAHAAPKGRVFQAALIYSAFWAGVAGFFPALVYERTPWGAVLHAARKIGELL